MRLGPQGPRVLLVLRVLLVPQAPRVLRGLRVSLDLLAPPALREFRASPGLPGPPGLLASPDPPDLRALRGLPAQLVLLVPPDLLGPKAFRALRVLRAPLAQLASPDLRVPLVLPESLVQRAQLAQQGQALLARQDPQVPLVLLVPLEAALPIGPLKLLPTRLSLVIGSWPTLLVARLRLRFRPRHLLATTSRSTTRRRLGLPITSRLLGTAQTSTALRRT